MDITDKLILTKESEEEQLRREVKNLTGTRWVHVNMFPASITNLNLECANHPVLMERLANHPMGEWEVKLAEIANYCELVLDGQYMPEDIERKEVSVCSRYYLT